MVLTSREERVLIAIKTRRKYSECVRVRVSGVPSYEQAGKASRMELQKGHEDLCRKRAKRAFFLWFFRDCHPVGVWYRPDIHNNDLKSVIFYCRYLNFKRLTMMTVCKPVEIKRRCQEQQHHCLHSLSLILHTSDSHPNLAIGCDGMRLGFRFDFQQHRTGAREQMWQLPESDQVQIWYGTYGSAIPNQLITFNVHI